MQDKTEIGTALKFLLKKQREQRANNLVKIITIIGFAQIVNFVLWYNLLMPNEIQGAILSTLAIPFILASRMSMRNAKKSQEVNDNPTV